MTSESHGLTYKATDESTSAPKFEDESYFVHHTLANKIALSLEFWSTFGHSTQLRLEIVTFKGNLAFGLVSSERDGMRMFNERNFML